MGVFNENREDLRAPGIEDMTIVVLHGAGSGSCLFKVDLWFPLLVGLSLLHQRRGSEGALLPQLGTVEIEYHWDRHQDRGDTAQKRSSPIDLERLEHVLAEEGEACTSERTEESVGSDG